MEERERLRDRLASLGEMAAGIAHELKNPLAGIEVMAGLLRRQVPDSPDAQSLLADIISEAKLANAIVVEMLEFVRPIRLQVEQTDIAEVLHQSVTHGRKQGAARRRRRRGRLPPDLPPIDGDHHQLCQVFTQPADQRVRGDRAARGAVAHPRRVEAVEQDPAFAADAPAPTPTVVVDVDRQRSRGAGGADATASSIRSSRPSRKARAWAWRSCGRSSTRTTGASTSSSEPGARHAVPGHAAGDRVAIELVQNERGSDAEDVTDHGPNTR